MQALTTVPPTHDFAITTQFIREPVDADDTVPVELYSRPYERVEIQPDSSPYERIEIERDAVAHAPRSSFRVVLALAIVCGAFFSFAVGFGLAFLMQ